MSKADVSIDPDTKVAALLDRYPELEEVLIGMAPPFRKLKNPVLRKSVARVASLRHAAAVAGLSTDDLVNTLRRAVGLDEAETDSESADASYFGDRPEWFDRARVVHSIEETDVDPDTMPLAAVMKKARELRAGQILVLVTSFLPAPGIDIIRKKGYLAWCTREDAGPVKTYISVP